MRIIRSIIADLGYMIHNIREFGFSFSGIKADLEYMIENIVDPTRQSYSQLTIDGYIKKYFKGMEDRLDQIYVRNGNGDYITAEGNTVFDHVDSVYFNGGCIDLVFWVY